MTNLADLLKLFMRTAKPTLGAMGLAGLGFFAAQYSLPLGIAVGALASLLLFPFADGYVVLLREKSMFGYRVLQAMVVIGIPVNIAAFSVNGFPLDLSGDSTGAAFNAVGVLGWGIGGSVVLAICLLRPRPPLETE